MNFINRHRLATVVSGLGVITLVVGILIGTSINSAIASEPDYVSLATQNTTQIIHHGTNISTASAK